MDTISAEFEKIRKHAFLVKRGISDKTPIQLDLLFPSIADRNDLRHIPNDYARSSLFSATNKKQTRRSFLQEQLFHYNEAVTIKYTGIELRAEDDELVWLQIIGYGQGVEMGHPFEFSVKDLVRDIGWPRNGRYYDKVRECISRLKANEVLALNSKAYGTSGAISLIQNYVVTNDDKGKPTNYRCWIDPNLVVLFAGQTFTSHSWHSYRKLSPVGRRLADYICSHQQPYPLSIEKFMAICGSRDSNMYSFRQTVRRACDEVKNAGIANQLFLKDDFILCHR